MISVIISIKQNVHFRMMDMSLVLQFLVTNQKYWTRFLKNDLMMVEWEKMKDHQINYNVI